jgi:hypothetical protein
MAVPTASKAITLGGFARMSIPCHKYVCLVTNQLTCVRRVRVSEPETLA